MDLEDPAINKHEKNSYSAITSNQICMYTSKNRFKNHVPCGRRQLIKLFASIKHFQIRTCCKTLFSTAQDQPGSQKRNLLTPRRSQHFSYSCFCPWGELHAHFPLVIYRFRFLKPVEFTGNQVSIPVVCTFKKIPRLRIP